MQEHGRLRRITFRYTSLHHKQHQHSRCEHLPKSVENLSWMFRVLFVFVWVGVKKEENLFSLCSNIVVIVRIAKHRIFRGIRSPVTRLVVIHKIEGEADGQSLCPSEEHDPFHQQKLWQRFNRSKVMPRHYKEYCQTIESPTRNAEVHWLDPEVRRVQTNETVVTYINFLPTKKKGG